MLSSLMTICIILVILLESYIFNNSLVSFIKSLEFLDISLFASNIMNLKFRPARIFSFSPTCSYCLGETALLSRSKLL